MKTIYIIIAVIAEIVCVITLIRDYRTDRENDAKYKLEDELSRYKPDPCDQEKTELCDYCMTDTCLHHANFD